LECLRSNLVKPGTNSRQEPGIFPAALDQLSEIYGARLIIGGERKLVLIATLGADFLRFQSQFIRLAKELNRRVGLEFLFDCRLMVGDRLGAQAH
jgi:hypothetical protein